MIFLRSCYQCYTVVSQTQIQWPNPPLNFISRTFFWSWWNQTRKRKQPQPGRGREIMRSPSGYVLVKSHGPTSLPQFGCRFIAYLHTGRAAFQTITHLSVQRASWVWCLGSQYLSNDYRWKVSLRQFLLRTGSPRKGLFIKNQPTAISPSTIFFESLLQIFMKPAVILD